MFAHVGNAYQDQNRRPETVVSRNRTSRQRTMMQLHKGSIPTLSTPTADGVTLAVQLAGGDRARGASCATHCLVAVNIKTHAATAGTMVAARVPLQLQPSPLELGR
jgi:hypothetical protein